MEKGIYKGVNSIEFHRRFQSDEDCFEYLSELKWGNDYTCKKCGCDRSQSFFGKYFKRHVGVSPKEYKNN